MYSENQLKKLISEYSGDIIKVSNIKNLTDDQCNSLECGDMVAKKTGKQYHLYLVTYKQAKHGLCLSYFDASVVETQSYDYTEGHWVYNSEDKTELGEFDPSTLYGKFVRLMDAPESTTLTDEQISQIKEGVFINGTFAGYLNPILCPCRQHSQDLIGLIISPDGYGTWASFVGIYKINTTSKVFSVNTPKITFNDSKVDIGSLGKVNNKNIPSYPANTGTFTLKCVDGVLTWVQDV